MSRDVEYMRIDGLVPALRNPKRHDIENLRASLKRFGYTVPALMDERTGRIAAGHGRLQLLQIIMDEPDAAPPEGIETDPADMMWMAPVTRGWSSVDDIEADAYLVADNWIGQLGGWDTRAQVASLQHLQAGRGLEGVGYTGPQIDDLLAKLQEKAPTAPVDAGNARNAQVRSLVLDYQLDQYKYVTETAARARSHYGAPSNAELFEAMLREYVEAQA